MKPFRFFTLAIMPICYTILIGSYARVSALESSVVLRNSQGINDRYSGIARISARSQCTGWLWQPTQATDKAWVVTSGHCVQFYQKRSTSYDVLVEQPAGNWSVTFKYFVDTQDDQVTIPISKIVYSTMKEVDLAILEIDSTYEELETQGISPLVLADSPPVVGEEVSVVGVPSGGVASHEAYLRRADCQQEGRFNVAEWHWFWSNTHRNSCLDISSGSSGSPMFNAAGQVFAVLNTTSHGAISQNCYLGNPCEVNSNEAAPAFGKNYGSEFIGVDVCFENGIASFSETCPLPTLDSVSFTTTLRNPTRPADEEAVPFKWNFDFMEQDPDEILWQQGRGSELTCKSVEGYHSFNRGAFPIEGTAIPNKNDLYQVCFVKKSQLLQTPLHPTVFNLFVDTIPPQTRPLVVYVIFGNTITFEPIFEVPEHSDFEVAWGRQSETDCATAKYVPYRRNPFHVSDRELPLKVCVKSIDHAGNRSEVFEEVYTGIPVTSHLGH